jgi:hypothetical protein
MSMDSHGGMILTRENQRTQRQTCPSTTLSTTNPAWTDPGLCGERPVTNRLSHGMTEIVLIITQYFKRISKMKIYDCTIFYFDLYINVSRFTTVH